MLNPDDYFTAADLYLDGLNCTLDVNISEADDPQHVMCWVTVTEYLIFHWELDEKTRDRSATGQSPLFSDPEIFEKREPGGDIELTDDARRELARLVSERYDGEDFAVRGDESDSCFTFEIGLEVPRGLEPGQLGARIYERTNLPSFANESDPGTFGCPYLFTLLMMKLREDAQR